MFRARILREGNSCGVQVSRMDTCSGGTNPADGARPRLVVVVVVAVRLDALAQGRRAVCGRFLVVDVRRTA